METDSFCVGISAIAMTFHYSHIAVASFGIAILAAWIAWMIWRRRRLAPGAPAACLLMLAIAEWTFARAFEAAVVEMPAKILWAQSEYLGIVSVPVLWLVFAFYYNRKDAWLTRRNVVLLWIFPVLTLAMVATNGWHGLIWNDIVPCPGRETEILIYSHGAWFFFQVAYGYALMLAGTIQIVQAAYSDSRLYKRQRITILIAALAPWVGNAVYILGYSPIHGMDLTPFSFTITGAIVLWSMFRYQLFDIVPVARGLLVESMADGVIVLDLQDRIVDINPAARKLIAKAEEPLVGAKLEEACREVHELIEGNTQERPSRDEVLLGNKDSRRYVEIGVSSMSDRYGRPTGRLINLHDVTERKKSDMALRLDEERVVALLQLNQMTEQSVQAVVDFALEEGVRLTRSQFGHIAFLKDDETFSSIHSVSKGALKKCEVRDIPIVLPVAGSGLWGESVRQRKPVIVNDYPVPNLLKKGYPEGHVRILRLLSVPVFEGEHTVATAGVANKEEEYDESDARQLALLMQGMWRLIQRKRSEEALKEAHARLSATLDALPDLLIELDPQGRICDYRAPDPELLSILPQRFLRRTVHEVLPGGAADVIAESIAKAQERGAHYGELFSLDLPSGERWFELSITVKGDPSGEDHRLIALCRDITERRRWELALEQSEERYRTLVEDTLDGYFLIAPESGKPVYFNQRICDIIGYSREELLEMVLWDVVPEEEHAVLRSHIQKLIEGEAPIRIHQVYSARRKDGSIIRCRVSASIVTFQGESVIQGVIRDVSAQEEPQA